jgi:hypothetical protein
VFAAAAREAAPVDGCTAAGRVCSAVPLIVYKSQVMMMHSDNNLSLILIETK